MSPMITLNRALAGPSKSLNFFQIFKADFRMYALLFQSKLWLIIKLYDVLSGCDVVFKVRFSAYCYKNLTAGGVILAMYL